MQGASQRQKLETTSGAHVIIPYCDLPHSASERREARRKEVSHTSRSHAHRWVCNSCPADSEPFLHRCSAWPHPAPPRAAKPPFCSPVDTRTEGPQWGTRSSPPDCPESGRQTVTASPCISPCTAQPEAELPFLSGWAAFPVKGPVANSCALRATGSLQLLSPAVEARNPPRTVHKGMGVAAASETLLTKTAGQGLVWWLSG